MMVFQWKYTKGKFPKEISSIILHSIKDRKSSIIIFLFVTFADK